MRKKTKIFLITLLIVLSCSVHNIVFAANFGSTTGFDAITVGNADTVAKNVVGTGIQVIRTIGTGVALIMISYIGIKYMMAAPNERAEFKKTAVIYVVGAILLFAGTNLLKIVVDFATSNVSTK